jgi:Family of unknown function (DUF6069)
MIMVLLLNKRRNMMQTLQNALPSRKERIDWSRLWWVGFGVLVASVVVNLLVRSAALALFPTMIMTADHIILFTVLGALGATLVFALVAWRAARPITLYRWIAGVALLLSFVPDILILMTGFPVSTFGVYILMHIATAAICVIGLTKFTQARNEEEHPLRNSGRLVKQAKQ